jgi:hypothetical protein
MIETIPRTTHWVYRHGWLTSVQIVRIVAAIDPMCADPRQVIVKYPWSQPLPYALLEAPRVFYRCSSIYYLYYLLTVEYCFEEMAIRIVKESKLWWRTPCSSFRKWGAVGDRTPSVTSAWGHLSPASPLTGRPPHLPSSLARGGRDLIPSDGSAGEWLCFWRWVRAVFQARKGMENKVFINTRPVCRELTYF